MFEFCNYRKPADVEERDRQWVMSLFRITQTGKAMLGRDSDFQLRIVGAARFSEWATATRPT